MAASHPPSQHHTHTHRVYRIKYTLSVSAVRHCRHKEPVINREEKLAEDEREGGGGGGGEATVLLSLLPLELTRRRSRRAMVRGWTAAQELLEGRQPLRAEAAAAAISMDKVSQSVFMQHC